MRSKVVKICIFVFFGISVLLTTISTVYLTSENQKLKETSKKINNINNEKEKVVSDNEKYKLDVENKKVELSEKLEEEEIWDKTKGKIEQAL